jgi:large subunit ribosomal protein L22
MGKLARPRKIAVNEASAKLTSLRSSPRKVSLVAALIRNMHVAEALVQLSFCRKRISNDVKKCLESAIANAENNHNLNIDNLYISSIQVGKAFVMKRFMARARGRSASIQKFFSNLTIVVSEKGE